jgi:hypothetical protein
MKTPTAAREMRSGPKERLDPVFVPFADAGGGAGAGR